jgi:hypothetical protein
MQLFQDSQLISGDIKAHQSNNGSIASHQSLTLASEAEPCHPERKKKNKKTKQTNRRKIMNARDDILISTFGRLVKIKQQTR